jgi:cytochrome c oxidase assembly protein subunit 15
MENSFGRRLLHTWAVLTAAATFFLLCSGGLVTSKGVGMAVPDWPTTFGYNMFLFPVSQWVGGIFYEHGHRLIASGVGLMTVLLAVAAFILEKRGWVKAFSLWLVIAVVIQGIFGGLRVVLAKDHIGIAHALLAQSFFSALLIFCVVTSRSYVSRKWADMEPDRSVVRWGVAITALLFCQLALGATMRHEHIGLAIPDFPLAYGQVIPDTSPAAMESINATRNAAGDVDLRPAFIWVHMAHRAMAVAICLAIAAFVWKTRQSANAIRRMAWIWAAMVACQFGLGVWTIWSNKAADIATAHMALGALLLGFGVMLSHRLILGARTARFVVPDSVSPHRVEALA